MLKYHVLVMSYIVTEKPKVMFEKSIFLSMGTVALIINTF